MEKTRNEEIEYVHQHLKDFGMTYLIRDYFIIRKTILNATNTYTNLMSFFNDYDKLREENKISEYWWNNALCDLYLLALLHIDDEEYEEIRSKYNDN